MKGLIRTIFVGPLVDFAQDTRRGIVCWHSQDKKEFVLMQVYQLLATLRFEYENKIVKASDLPDRTKSKS